MYTQAPEIISVTGRWSSCQNRFSANCGIWCSASEAGSHLNRYVSARWFSEALILLNPCIGLAIMSYDTSVLQGISSLTFDLMGTCLDWLTNVHAQLAAAPPLPPGVDVRELAMAWRQGFFDEILRAWDAGEEVKDKDVVHDMVLQRLLREHGLEGAWDEGVRKGLLASWHTQYGMFTYRGANGKKVAEREWLMRSLA